MRLPRRRRRRRLEWETLALGVAALGTTSAVVVLELGRTWRRGSAPLPVDTDKVIAAAALAVRETRAVARAGYEESPRTENALLNLLGSFVVAFGLARVSTWSIRRRGSFGPFHDVKVGRRHIHHFVPGILIAFVAGAVSILKRDERLDPWLALPFGAGLGLTLDESALLLELDDVYWSARGIVSVQITLGVLSLLSLVALALRVLRRGEARVLEPPPGVEA